MQNLIEGLNDKQKEAVLATEGPCLVIAGAGSGKTKVLTHKIAYLISEKNVKPYNILAITFTNKAASEMKQRVEKIVGDVAQEMWMGTFHSICVRILRRFIDRIGFDTSFLIFDTSDQKTVVKECLKALNIDDKTFSDRSVLSEISNAKNEMLTPKAYQAKYSGEFRKEKIGQVYELYQKRLRENNAIDFDDIINYTIDILSENPDVLQYYTEKFKYVLVDEYQDTNKAQFTLVTILASRYGNITVVGDNDQGIYSFRGADISNILNFEKDYKNCEVILLEENYRSTKNILDAANSVIKHNKDRKDKNLKSNNGIGEKVKYVKVETDKDECSYVSSKINELHNSGVRYEDIAILYRTNAQSRILEEEMLKNGIPYRIVGSFYFYNRKEIKDLLCYLRLINNPLDDVSLLRVINTPKRGIGDKTIDALSEKANNENISLFDAISEGKELKFKNLILEMQELAQNLTLTQIVDMVLDKSGMKEEFGDKTLDGEIRLENLEEFKSITKNYEEEYGVLNLEDFLAEISLVSDVEEYKDEDNRVSLMTIHSVKGLEFDNVFVTGMEEEIFPHYNSINEGTRDAIEEERRLCYVAITRAKKNLWLLNAKKRMLFGNVQHNLPSRFMDEIDPDYLEVINNRETLFNKVTKIVNKEEMYKKSGDDYSVGDHVKHTEFGEGIIVKIDGIIAVIAFAHPYGIKKIMKTHKNLSKV